MGARFGQRSTISSRGFRDRWQQRLEAAAGHSTRSLLALLSASRMVRDLSDKSCLSSLNLSRALKLARCEGPNSAASVVGSMNVTWITPMRDLSGPLASTAVRL